MGKHLRNYMGTVCAAVRRTAVQYPFFIRVCRLRKRQESFFASRYIEYIFIDSIAMLPLENDMCMPDIHVNALVDVSRHPNLFSCRPLIANDKYKQKGKGWGDIFKKCMLRFILKFSFIWQMNRTMSWYKHGENEFYIYADWWMFCAGEGEVCARRGRQDAFQRRCVHSK